MISTTKVYVSKPFLFLYVFLLSYSPLLGATADITGTLRFPVGYPDKKGAVLWIEGKDRQFQLSHPAPAVINQRDVQFQPYLTVVNVGSTIIFKNSDPHLHMIKSQDGPLQGFRSAMIPTNGRAQVTATRVGASELLCDIHSQMHAFVVVVPNEFFAVSNDEGKFSFRGVPPPPFTVKVWHDVLPPLTIKIKDSADLKKLTTIEIKSW